MPPPRIKPNHNAQIVFCRLVLLKLRFSTPKYRNAQIVVRIPASMVSLDARVSLPSIPADAYRFVQMRVFRFNSSTTASANLSSSKYSASVLGSSSLSAGANSDGGSK
jgi:hypothetical protein